MSDKEDMRNIFIKMHIYFPRELYNMNFGEQISHRYCFIIGDSWIPAAFTHIGFRLFILSSTMKIGASFFSNI